MSLVTELSEAVDQLLVLFIENEEDLGIAKGCIFYGDQERLPGSPALCVEPDEKKVELYGAGRMTEVKLSIYILVYHSEIKEIQSNRRDADRLAERISQLLNSDATFEGRAIHCYVTNQTSGYSKKQNTTLRSTRIAFEIETQERLPNNP